MNKYLVTIDGSDHSKKVLEEAKAHAMCSGADIVIMNVLKDIVIDPYARISHDGMLSDKERNKFEESAEELLKDSLKLFTDFPREVKTILARGNAADEIIREAEKGNYELVVMGSRGLGTFSRAMLGSISNKVLNHVNANVFIVK